jgi:hypothetical protein
LKASNEQRKDFARQVLAFEARAATTRAERDEATAAVFEKASGVLAPVIGADAVDAIFKRSVRLTKRDFSCLELVSPPGQRVDARACLRGCLKDVKDEAPTLCDAAIALYTRFFTSIDVLIGERLTSRIIQGAWPDMPIDRSGTKEEKKR